MGGSLLHTRRPLPVEDIEDSKLDRANPAGAYGAVRFFSPKEICNLLGFPMDFLLPREMKLQHRYKVVGNSIAVSVATELLRFLLLGESEKRLRCCEQVPPSVQLRPRKSCAAAG